MLIRNAEVWQRSLADVRIQGGAIAAVGALEARAGERVIEANGGALLPGLHDHHIHLAGTAVRAASVECGPPEVSDAEELARALNLPGTGWVRGIGYHESVLGGLPDARELDRLCSHRLLRIQHRSGRMWLLNSLALDELLSLAAPPPGLEQVGGKFTGRLFDEDAWLRKALDSSPPDFADPSRELARSGVTGITDMTPQNDPTIARHFSEQAGQGRLLQRCVLAGTLELASTTPEGWTLGPVKLHLHEAELPQFEQTTDLIASAHKQDRPVAIHCVSEVELVFALAALEDGGTMAGDRIEHASIASRDLVERMAALDLSICVQPHFIAERGDQYLADVEPRQVPDLYRLRTLATAGLPLAGGSDAPFGAAKPWASMRAAVLRETASGVAVGIEEALTPEEALSLYLADPHDLSRQRAVEPGAHADLCLLDRPWNEARTRLSSQDVAATFVSGRLVHDHIDQAPAKSLPG